MKVLLDVTSVSTPLTGIGRYSLELAHHLSQHPALARLCYLTDDTVSDEFNDDPHGIAPRRETGALRKFLKAVIPRGWLLLPYRKFKNRRLSTRLLAYRDFIFHSPNFSLPPFAGKSVVTLHDLSVFHYPEYHPADRVEFLREQIHASVVNADKLVTDSDFVRGELIELFGVSAERVCAIPLGVDSVFRPRSRDELGDRLRQYKLDDKQYLLSVGTIEPRKNLAGLLRAYLQIDRDLREAHPLVIVGAYGWGCDELVEEVEALDRSGAIIYLRYVPECDLPYIYAGATTFCYLSFYEGFGLPVLEAMSSGIPVVCSNASALPEVCAADALQVDPMDDAAIASALDKSLTDIAWRDQTIAAGLEKSAGYRWDHTATRLVALYGELQ